MKEVTNDKPIQRQSICRGKSMPAAAAAVIGAKKLQMGKSNEPIDRRVTAATKETRSRSARLRIDLGDKAIPTRASRPQPKITKVETSVCGQARIEKIVTVEELRLMNTLCPKMNSRLKSKNDTSSKRIRGADLKPST